MGRVRRWAISREFETQEDRGEEAWESAVAESTVLGSDEDYEHACAGHRKPKFAGEQGGG